MELPPALVPQKDKTPTRLAPLSVDYAEVRRSLDRVTNTMLDSLECGNGDCTRIVVSSHGAPLMRHPPRFAPFSFTFLSGAFFSCGEADNSSRDKWCSFFFLLSFFTSIVQKKAKTVQTNMIAHVIWAINFKSEVRYDLRPPRLFGDHSGLKTSFSLLVSN